MNIVFEKYLLDVCEASSCKEIEVIQTLWSGYGKISRFQLEDAKCDTVVVKSISLEKASEHPRAWNTDKGHERKLRSYEVETIWYESWSSKSGPDSYMPQFIGALKEGEMQWIVMEDLNEKYPLRKNQIDLKEIKVCLRWLANFHATFMNDSPDGLWEIGTYWHLATRSEEFEKIEDAEVKAKAHLIDEKLNKCTFKTIVHGDAKLANFCFSGEGSKVAAVDFQYVGGGCGMKDVAYFLGGCLSGEDCSLHEKDLLDFYFDALSHALEERDVDFKALEKEWREMYSFACADFTRFLLGWMPSHQKINEYQMKAVREVLALI